VTDFKPERVCNKCGGVATGETLVGSITWTYCAKCQTVHS